MHIIIHESSFQNPNENSTLSIINGFKIEIEFKPSIYVKFTYILCIFSLYFRKHNS